MVHVREFTDPACPFAFSAEPALWRLRWLYGPGLDWETRMVALSDSPDEYEAKGFTPDKQSRRAQDAAGEVRDADRLAPAAAHDRDARPPAAPWWRPACTRPTTSARILRALRVRDMAGELIDEPATIDRAARDAGIDPRDLARWSADPAIEQALSEDIRVARRPSSASIAQVHKLAETPDGGHRYTCPSLELTGPDGRRIDLPGFQPVEAYEAAIANLAPELERRATPKSVDEVLDWAEVPLATVEVATIMGIDPVDARTELARVADETPVGPDGYWSLPAQTARVAA